MTFLKTSEGRVGQDPTRWRAARKAEPDVESNLPRVPALGKGCRTGCGCLQKDRDHRGNRPGLDHSQIARHQRMVCGMWPGGGHGGVERGGGAFGHYAAQAVRTSDDPTDAPRLWGQPGLALVASCRRVAADLPGVGSGVEVERITNCGSPDCRQFDNQNNLTIGTELPNKGELQ
jgi:hypothetical protein